jgi:predicted choloylglycine hydrolase
LKRSFVQCAPNREAAKLRSERVDAVNKEAPFGALQSNSEWQELLERVRGIEPLYEAWEAAVLPLNYTRELTQSNGHGDVSDVLPKIQSRKAKEKAQVTRHLGFRLLLSHIA